MSQCKQKIQPLNGPERQCRKKVWAKYPEDGYCSTHHPETIEEEELREIANEKRTRDRQQCFLVGRWMMKHDKDRFAQIVAEIGI